MYNIGRPTSAVGKDTVCGVRRKSAVSEMSYRRCEKERCAVPGGENLQCKEKVVPCVERVYTIRRATSAVGGLSVWCEEKVSIMRKVTSAVQRE